jgi:hypothetical protein
MWEKPKIVRINGQTFPVQIMINKTPGECGIFRKLYINFQSNAIFIIQNVIKQ